MSLFFVTGLYFGYNIIRKNFHKSEVLDLAIISSDDENKKIINTTGRENLSASETDYDKSFEHNIRPKRFKDYNWNYEN